MAKSKMILQPIHQSIKVRYKNAIYFRSKKIDGTIAWLTGGIFRSVTLHEAMELEKVFQDDVIQQLPEYFNGVEIINE